MREKGNSRKDFEQLNRKIDKLVATNSQLVSQISNFSKKIEDLETANKCQSKEFTEAINGLKTTINELKATIKEKDSEIADLREKLNKDSTNSSKPPSTDFYKKPNPKPSTLNSRDRKGTVKKTNGGQKGHPGKTMELKEEPDAVQRCTPKACDGCPLFGECKTTVVGSRSVVDVVIQTFQTQFDQIQCNCPKQGGAIIKGEYPAGVNSHFQYGPTLGSLAVTLSSFGMMSLSRIVETLNALTGLNMSDATVNNMILSCSNKCKKLLPELRNRLLDSHSIGFDETGIRVCGKNHWMHTAATKNLTLLASSPQRGWPGIDECGVLGHFKGTAVHDSWAPYYNVKYSGATHALCCAHIDRELQGIAENYKQRWPKQFQKLLMAMYMKKSELLDKGVSKAPDDMLKEFSDQYDMIVGRGVKRNPIPKVVKKTRGRPKKGKPRSLVDRLQKHKDEVMRFFTDFKVPYSNNLAEKSYRLSKKKMQIAGTFRASDGGERFATIFSIIDTCRKNGMGPIEALFQIFTDTFSLDFISQPAG